MKNFKKLAALLLAMIMIASMAACGNKNDGGSASDPETVGETEPADETEPAGDETEPADDGSDEGNDEAGESALDKGVLIMGVDDTFAPMGFRDENNDIVGFDIDLALAVGEHLGVEIQIQPIEWSMKELELNQGNVDLIWNGYTITDKRKEEVNFTNAYLDNKQIVVVLADSDIYTLEDLAGKVVAAQTDSSALEAIDSLPEIRESFADLVTQETNDMCIMELEGGRSEAVVADSVLLEYVISHKDDPSKFRILDEDFGSEEFGIGVRKEDTRLLDAVNEALNALKENGKAAEISTEWFGSNIVK